MQNEMADDSGGSPRGALAFLCKRLNARPKRLLVDLWNHCNFRCVHCCQESGPEESRQGIDEKLFESLVHEAADIGVEAVTLLGGEPTLHPGVSEFVRVARHNGLAPSVVSNGWLLDRELTASLSRAGCKEVVLSLYGHSREVHDAVTAKPGSFGRVLQAARATITAGMALRINFLVTAPDAPALLDLGFWQMIQDLHPRQVKLAHFFPLGRGGRVAATLSIHPRAYLDILGRLGRWVFPFPVSMSQYYIPPSSSTGEPEVTTVRCRDRLGELPGVLRDGTLLPCCSLSSMPNPPTSWSREQLDSIGERRTCAHLPASIMGYGLLCPLVEERFALGTELTPSG
jgi:MoaA/NifB/PqqE/SkfB family radical SAM enzyme